MLEWFEEGRTMTAFARTWDLVKEWTPNWRETASKLPSITPTWSKSNSRNYEALLGDDTGFDEGGHFGIFSHPHDDRFVVKIPRLSPPEGKSLEDDAYDAIYDRIRGLTPDGRSYPQVLEELGYPVMSEMDKGLYLIQPRVASEGNSPVLAERNMGGVKGRPPMHVANTALDFMFGDRTAQNFGRDQTGNWRFLDPDVYRADMDYSEFINGEHKQQMLNEDEIQLPVTALLNQLDLFEDNYITEGRSMLEALEPHSDNPPLLTVGGRPVWREGY